MTVIVPISAMTGAIRTSDETSLAQVASSSTSDRARSAPIEWATIDQESLSRTSWRNWAQSRAKTAHDSDGDIGKRHCDEQHGTTGERDRLAVVERRSQQYRQRGPDKVAAAVTEIDARRRPVPYKEAGKASRKSQCEDPELPFENERKT